MLRVRARSGAGGGQVPPQTRFHRGNAAAFLHDLSEKSAKFKDQRSGTFRANRSKAKISRIHCRTGFAGQPP